MTPDSRHHENHENAASATVQPTGMKFGMAMHFSFHIRRSGTFKNQNSKRLTF